MKRIFIQRLLIAGTALMLNTNTPAQISHTTAPFVIADAGTHSSLLADLKAKNAKSYSHFTNTFPEAIMHKIRQEKDGTHINATVNGNSLRVHYDNKGRFRSSVLTYPCSDLKEQIADQVVLNFPGYSIFGTVQEVTVGNKSALLVMIENKKSWKRVRLINDGMDIYEEFTKSL